MWHDRSDRTRRKWMLAILMLALLLRLPSTLKSGLSGDEADFLMISQCSVKDMVTGAALAFSNPPLHMVVQHLLMAVFDSNIHALKLACVLMNLGWLCLAMYLVDRWLGSSLALGVGFLGAINPLQISQATELRAFSMLGLLALTALVCAERYREKGSIGALVGWSVACAAGFWTHYSMAPVSLVSGIYVLLAVRKRPRLLAMWCIGGAIAVAAMALWIPALAVQYIGRGGGYSHWHFFGSPIVHCLGTSYLRPDTGLPLIAVGGLAALAAFGIPFLIGIVSLWRRSRSLLLYGIALLGVSIGAPLVRSAAIGALHFASRHIFAANVVILLFVASGLAAVGRTLRIGLTTLIVILSAISIGQFETRLVGRSVQEKVITKVVQLVSPEEALVVRSPPAALRARYYSNQGLEVLYVDWHCPFHPDLRHNRVWRVPVGATWLDLTRVEGNPALGFSASTLAELRSRATVWFLSHQRPSETSECLGSSFRRHESISLIPGRHFGHESQHWLTCYRRKADPASSKPAP